MIGCLAGKLERGSGDGMLWQDANYGMVKNISPTIFCMITSIAR